MKRAVFYDELVEARNNIGLLSRDLEKHSSSLKTTSRVLRGIDDKYKGIASNIDVRVKSIQKIIEHLQKGSDAIESVYNQYLLAEKLNYQSISGIKVIDKSVLDQFIDMNVHDLNLLLSAYGVTVDVLNKTRKGIEGVGDLLENIRGIEGLEQFDFFKNFTDTEAFKLLEPIKYLADANKLAEAIASNDVDAQNELVEKYFKKGLGTAITSFGKVSKFEGAGYASLIFTFGENVAEEICLFGSPSRSTPLEIASGVWNVTGHVMIETAVETAWDIVDDVGSVFGVDLDKVYEELTGTPGVDGFYKATGMLANEVGKFWGSTWNGLWN
ncbi:MAG: hypothetical protein AB9921_03150 [Erysipelotrichaceae bacterium]